MGKSKIKSIGVDIGGTKIAIAAVENDGKLLASAIIPTEAEKKFAMALDRIGATIEKIMAQVGWVTSDLCGIGIGCAGPVNSVAGTINNPYTLPEWDNCNIVIPLKVLKAQMGNKAGVVGAAYLPWERRH